MKNFLNRYLPGVLSILFYSVHALSWILKGEPSNLLWACHLGALAVGFGWIFKVPALNASGSVMLVMGNIFWGIFLAGGGEFEFTSLLTHDGSLVIGLIGIYRMGIPRFTWLYTLLALFALQFISRFTTNEAENVNLAFRVHEGWENLFPDYFWYEVFLFFDAALTFFLTEIIIRWLSGRLKRRKN